MEVLLQELNDIHPITGTVRLQDSLSCSAGAEDDPGAGTQQRQMPLPREEGQVEVLLQKSMIIFLMIGTGPNVC